MCHNTTNGPESRGSVRLTRSSLVGSLHKAVDINVMCTYVNSLLTSFEEFEKKGRNEAFYETHMVNRTRETTRELLKSFPSNNAWFFCYGCLIPCN